MAKRFKGLVAAQKWLTSHSGSVHTRRKYESQLQQFCEWLILRDLDFQSVSVANVEQYLLDYASGEVRIIGARKTRSHRTLVHTRSVLSSLFDELEREEVRRSNPVRMAKLPLTSPVQGAELQDAADQQSRLKWMEVRAEIIERARIDTTPRSPLRRAVAIAEMATWVGLRCSEMEVTTMADFQRKAGQWWLKVPRYGHGAEDEIEVPLAAMEAITLYRTSRGLTPLPGTRETSVPLVARLTSEVRVDAWTIGNALKDLLSGLQGDGQDKRQPTIVALRREVAYMALKAKVSDHQLARHLRSKSLVDEVSRNLQGESIVPTLQRLAA